MHHNQELLRKFDPQELAKLAVAFTKPLRTVREIRMLAKEMCEEWWEGSVRPPKNKIFANDKEAEQARHRSEIFRRSWPNKKFYVQTCWPYFYKLAREQMVSMLGMSDVEVSPTLKESIYKALMAERQREFN